MFTTSGIDVSQWQGEINWELVAAAGYRFAFIRATMGDDGTDARFYVNWGSARDAGLLVSAYHVVKPDRPADSQINHFFNVLGDRKSDLPLVLDIELSGDLGRDDITAHVRYCLYRVEQLDGRRPIIYTAGWFWNQHVLPSSEWAGYNLWVASYTSDPLIPAGWSFWEFWQYSEKGSVPGISSATDLNWFSGSYEELLSYAGRALHPPQPSLGLWARVIAPINVRSSPGLEHDDIGDLDPGAVVRILNLDGRDAWIAFEAGKWAAFTIEGRRYMIPRPQPHPQPGLQARVIYPLNVRNGPGTDYDDIGDLDTDEVLNIQAVNGKDVWIEFEPGKWAVFATEGKRYMELQY